MLNSAIAILTEYIDGVTPYNFYSLLMERGENGEDVYYLCEVGDDFYVVLETDYIDPRPYQAQEAADAFAPIGVEVVGWVVRKDQIRGEEGILPPDISLDQTRSDLLVTARESSYLKHAVLKMKSLKSKKHYHPGVYGSAK